MNNHCKANGARLSRLLIDKGTEAMRNVFDSICPPPTLANTLNNNYVALQLLRGSVIKSNQMDILFPPIPLAPSKSENYDITLLFILLRNICGLHPPTTTGSWDAKPPAADHTREAALVRIKYYRNTIYAHLTTTGVDDVHFQSYWNDISDALIRLGVTVGEIEDLKRAPLEVVSQKKIKMLASVWSFSFLVTMMCLFYNSPKENQASSPLDFSSHLNISNSEFVGRKWFFQELEHAINNSCPQSTGVIILGDPGSGKSAIMSQLISSPSSSQFIHKNIIGYHVCKFDEDRTRDGMRFVHTLVHQLSKNIPEYSSVINKTIKNELNTHCKAGLIDCFRTTILDPIKEIKWKQNTNKFILIDALDECIEIITILKNKFPAYIKLIISSRNKKSFIAQLPTFEKLSINSTDQRNLEDISSYIDHVMHGNDRFKTEPEKNYGEGLIEQLYKSNEGNFLYFKTLLQYLNKNNVSNLNRDFFPPTLDHLYGFIFRDRFEKGDFDRFAPFFEVLLASNTPPTMTELEAIIKIQNDTYNIQNVFEQVSEYLIIGSDQTVRFYHQSFANWLMNQIEDCDGLFVQKFKGHRYIADHRFDYLIHKRNTTLTVQELSGLSMHVLFGKMEEKQVSKLKGLNVNEIRDSKSGECILHELAKEKESTPIIEIFLKNFDSIDIFTKISGSTPLCYAASSGNFDNLKLFIDNGADVDSVFDSNHWTMLMVARNGYTEIAEMLILNGVDFDKESLWRTKPLLEGIENGHLDFVQVLVKKWVKPDVIALHRAVKTNHYDIVRFLLNTGIRDVCLDCKPGNFSCWSTSRHLTLNQSHLCLCETALHAAVSKGDLNIIKLLLSYGKDALECKHLSGKTPLLEAAERNDTEMATLLLNNGANVEAECGTLISIYKYWKLVGANFYTENCNKNVCSCGTRSIHIFAKQRSWEMVKNLISRWNANPFSENCQGLNPVSIAIIQDRVSDFIHNFNATYAGEITKFIMNKTALRHIAVCGSQDTLKWLTSVANSSFFQTCVYEDGMTLLHLAAQWSADPTYIGFNGWKIQSCTEEIHGDDDLIKIRLQNINEYKKRLVTVRLLTKLQQNINKTDKYGRTALHYAAARGFAGAVKHLVSQGSDWRIKDVNGETPLELALKESPVGPRDVLPCRMTSDGVFQSCNSTMFDETVRYLIMLQKSSINKCNADTQPLVRKLVEKNMPLSLYNLFKIGVDVNCGVAFKMQLNILKPNNEEISEVFKIFEVNINVECDVHFKQSELHLMAYLGMLYDIGNFFKPSVNNKSFPLQRFINNHPKGFRVFDECRDKEGYLAIHRAVEGGNVHAVSWLISLGVDIFKKTKSGLNALDLSLYYLVPERCLKLTLADHNDLQHYLLTVLRFDYQNHDPLHVQIDRQHEFYNSATEKLLLVQKEVCVLRERTSEILLEQSLKTIKYKDSISFSWCKLEFAALSPLHIAAARGMERLNYVHQKVRSLPISCTNKHEIEPRYLAYLYESVRIVGYSSSPSLDHAYEGRYPEREAEYHLIYSYLFQTPEVDLSVELEFECLLQCPGINDFLPKRIEIEEKIEQCNNQCLKSTSQVMRNFVFAFPGIIIENASFDTFGKGFIHTFPQMSKLRYHAAKMFYKIPSRFWRQVSEAYSCSYRCRCVEIMRFLREKFISQPRRHRQVGKFVVERMGWKDRSINGDATYRWPFGFLLKKALKKDKDYEYLKNIGEFIIW